MLPHDKLKEYIPVTCSLKINVGPKTDSAIAFNDIVIK